jgi:hypothetical protein
LRWIIHIGAPKTGSTSIQRFLFEHREALRGLGIEYPNANLRGFGHHDLAFLLAGGYPDWATPQNRPLAEIADDLRRAARNTSAKTLVLSSENFYLYPRPKQLGDLLVSVGLRPDDDLTIVCYVRRQDEAHISWYNQTVKAQGNARSFEATVALTRDLWDYGSRLAPWATEFGASRLLARDYAPFTAGSGDVRWDFSRILGLPEEAFDYPPARENERISRDILEFQRAVNRLPLTAQSKRRYHKRLIKLTAVTAGSGVFDDSPFLTERERAALLATYEESNASVARKYLGRERLFELPASVTPEATPAARRGLTPAKVARVLKGILLPNAN